MELIEQKDKYHYFSVNTFKIFVSMEGKILIEYRLKKENTTKTIQTEGGLQRSNPITINRMHLEYIETIRYLDASGMRGFLFFDWDLIIISTLKILRRSLITEIEDILKVDDYIQNKLIFDVLDYFKKQVAKTIGDLHDGRYR